MRCLLEGLRDNHRNRFTVVPDLAVLQERDRAAGGRIQRRLALLRQPRCIVSGEHAEDAWHSRRSGRVDRDDGAACDRALHDHRVRKVRYRPFRAVARAPGHFETSVETRDRMADICAKNLLAGLRGEKLPAWVNPEASRKI